MSSSQINLRIFRLFVFISLTLSPGFVLAQSRADFYPLHVGDYWEYVEEGWRGRVVTKRVLSDSMGADRIIYYRLRVSGGFVGTEYEWVTDSLDVYGGTPNRSYLLYRLKAEVGDTWDDEIDPSMYTKLERIYEGTVLGVSTQMMEFVRYIRDAGHGDIDVTSSTLAQGFGLIGYWGDNLLGWVTGAIINGVKYGTIKYLPVENDSWGRIKALFR